MNLRRGCSARWYEDFATSPQQRMLFRKPRLQRRCSGHAKACRTILGAWLTRVAFRRMADHARSESARRRRESEVAEGFLGAAHAIESTDIYSEQDDTLVLLFMCCHPALTSASAIALTLRAVGGDGPRCCERFKSNHEKNNHQSFLVYPGVSDTWLRCSYPLVSERAGKRPGKSREISTVDLSESGAAIDGAALSH